MQAAAAMALERPLRRQPPSTLMRIVYGMVGDGLDYEVGTLLTSRVVVDLITLTLYDGCFGLSLKVND